MRNKLNFTVPAILRQYSHLSAVVFWHHHYQVTQDHARRGFSRFGTVFSSWCPGEKARGRDCAFVRPASMKHIVISDK